MGIEYWIKCPEAPSGKKEEIILRLANPVRHGWPAFSTEITDDGFHFCDNCGNDPETEKAFMRLINFALDFTGEVTIRIE